MEHLITISGPMLLDYLKNGIDTKETTVHAAILVNAPLPSFVGDNYYCESGNPNDTFVHYHLDRLWDGERYEDEHCSNGKSQPWFSMELPNPTTDDIEVCICLAEDNTLVQLLEVYVQ